MKYYNKELKQAKHTERIKACVLQKQTSHLLMNALCTVKNCKKVWPFRKKLKITSFTMLFYSHLVNLQYITVK